MNLRALVLSAATAAALLSTALAPAAARAGTYSITLDTAKDTSGWSFTGSSGFSGCALRLHPGPCGDDDVPNPTPLRIFGFGQAAKLANAWWQWDAPATTTIASGSLSVNYKTAATGTSAYMKARLRTESFPASAQVHSATGNASDTWSIPSGNQVVGVFLKTDIARDYTDKWNNNLKVTTLTATLTDDTAPAVTLSGPLADGTWHNEGQPVPLTVAATDAGAGVASATLAQAGATLASNSVPRQTGIHAGLTAYSPRSRDHPGRPRRRHPHARRDRGRRRRRARGRAARGAGGRTCAGSHGDAARRPDHRPTRASLVLRSIPARAAWASSRQASTARR